jgi:ubiquinone/menaquinone biosynthesis C-methylase UbiE
MERMDAPDVDPAALESALDQVARVNRWLGARRALLYHLGRALHPDRTRVLDVGTGAGDLPLAAAEWARAKGRPIQITAIDRHPATLAVAARRLAHSGIRLARADGLRLPFRDGAFDLALLSMTLHHMDGGDLVAILRELARVARGGRVLVAELERSLPHYLGARFLAATVWRHDPITRHDGPLSVRRSFTPAELLALGIDAGLDRPSVHRHLLFRLVLTGDARA